MWTFSMVQISMEPYRHYRQSSFCHFLRGKLKEVDLEQGEYSPFHHIVLHHPYSSFPHHCSFDSSSLSHHLYLSTKRIVKRMNWPVYRILWLHSKDSGLFSYFDLVAGRHDRNMNLGFLKGEGQWESHCEDVMMGGGTGEDRPEWARYHLDRHDEPWVSAVALGERLTAILLLLHFLQSKRT